MKASQSMKTNGIVGIALLFMVMLLSACERAAPPIETRPAATIPPALTQSGTAIATTTQPGNPTVLPTIAQAGTLPPASLTRTPSATTSAATATRSAATSAPTVRPQASTATPVPPSPTPANRPTSAPLPTNATGRTTTVKLYLIAINDNGATGTKIGCNDSVVAVNLVMPQTTSPLTDATKQLLALKSQYYGQSGLYNVFYQSKLVVDSVIISSGKATFNLRGTLSLGGECDDPRVEAQLRYMALQFSTVKTVEIFVNSKKLSSVLGGQ